MSKMSIFYTIQGDAGEEIMHPNMFHIKAVPGYELAHQDIIENFPLRDTGQFHFRYRTAKAPKGNFVWTDMASDPSASVPKYHGKVFMQVLRLDRLEADYEFEFCEPVFANGHVQDAPCDHQYEDEKDNEPPPSKPARRPQKKKISRQKITRQKKPRKKLVRRSTSSLMRDHDNYDDDNHQQGGEANSKEKPSPLQFDDDDKEEGNGHVHDLIAPSPTEPMPTEEEDMPSMTSLLDTFKMHAEEPAMNLRNRVKDAVEKNTKKAKAKLDIKNAVLNAHMENESRLQTWADDSGGGGMKNIRTLLATLDEVLFPWAKEKWKPVGVADMLQASGVRLAYFKAMRVVHTDRLPKDATPEDHAIADMLYKALNKAWVNFQAQQK